MNEMSLLSATQPGWRTWVSANQVWIFALGTPMLSVAVILLPLPVLVGPMLVVFFPALLAILLIHLSEGKGHIKNRLFNKTAWGLNRKWIFISLGLSVALRLVVSLIGLVIVTGYQFQPSPFTLFHLIPFLFAAAEEIGWRGYALPHLLKRGYSPLKAAIVLGIPWGLMHLSLTLPGKLAEGAPPLAEFLVLISMAIITSWLYIAAKNNVLAPTLLHGGQNVAVNLNDGLPLITNTWLLALVYGLVVLGIVVFTRGRLGQKQQP